MTLMLLMIFAAAIGSATFIEEKFDTVTARLLVYDAWWFEVVLLLLAINFFGMTTRYKMWRREKIASLMFHLAFVLIIIGAGITRYFGFEGVMHIREGSSSHVIYSSEPYLQVSATAKDFSYSLSKPLQFSEAFRRGFSYSFKTPSNKEVDIAFNDYMKNGVSRSVAGKEGDTVVRVVRGGMMERGSEVLLVDVSYGGKTQTIPLFAGTGFSTPVKEIDLDGVKLKLSYGNKEINLPFSLYLDDFVLDRYAGSMSPSSYASEVTLVDPGRNIKEKRRIYMNHVLDHRGYRFFQSSYDADEMGTVLSVNHDQAGTWVSYAGYILLALGFIATLFNPGSRFRSLSRAIEKIRAERKAGIPALVLILLAAAAPGFAQKPVQPAIGAAHAEKFGHLLVQTFDGRFEPIHTMAYDVLHKISRQDHIHTEAKGDLDAVQVFLDILMDPGYWRQQKIIYIREKSVRDVLGVDGQYACLNDFVDGQSKYKLAPHAEEAFRKRPARQNAFDKEIIRVDERVNIWLSVQNGALFKIFPLPGSPNHRWISFVDSLASLPLEGKLLEMNRDLPLNTFDYNNMMRYYLQTVYDGASGGDYSKTDAILKRLENIQRGFTPANLLPSVSMVNTEIWYNKSALFVMLRNIYGLLSILLLVFAFADNLRSKKSRPVTWVLNTLAVLLGVAFIYHTFGMGLRWYLTGHAPWSNGYEALLLIAWGGLLAGFCFMKYSRITLAATAVLAFMVLMTAGHSSYDPQLTNLQPVLKSYWLIIHVAVITVSYGFLSLGFLLGLINLCIWLFMTRTSSSRLTLIIKELTLTNEMALTIGIVLATIGTFLGGVWASESWGRYWGWDAKETWALVIVITYAMILHLRFVPGMKGAFTFNVASVIGFGSVVMTFVGVNYYLSKGLHSYAADDRKVFPVWAWGLILAVIFLILAAWYKERLLKTGDANPKG